MPVVLVITKFDQVVSQVFFDSFSDAPQQLNRARDSANRIYEESCRRVFNTDPGAIPAEIVSGTCSFLPVLMEGSTWGQLTSSLFTVKASFCDLIENLVGMTDELITDSRGSTHASAQAGKQRLGAVPLSWSAAVRVNHDVVIQSTIECVVFVPLLYDFN